MKWKMMKVIGWLVILFFVAGALFWGRQAVTEEGVCRSEVARSVALLLASPQECRKETETLYFSEEEEKWYQAYAAYLYEQLLWTTVETPADDKTLEGEYTYTELWGLLDRARCESRWTARRERGGEQSVPRRIWEKVWDELRLILDVDHVVQEQEFLVYGTPAQISGLGIWTAATSLGELTYEGLNLNGYEDRKVKAWVREGAMLHLPEIVERKVCYENVLVMEFAAETKQDSRLRFFVEGIEKEYHLPGQHVTQEYTNILADVHLKDGNVEEIQLKTERIHGKILSVTEEAIEIQGYGRVGRDAHLKVYRTYQGIEQLSADEIRLGSESESFIVANGKICGVLQEQAPNATKIRVLLKTNGFADTMHSQVEVTCDEAFQVTHGDQTDLYRAGERVVWNVGDLAFASGRVVIEPVSEGKLQVMSIERAQGTPAYAGQLELLETDGGIIVINEVLLETYLAAVLPSEMPESYGLEALKAQAVCARSYAYRQMTGRAYAEYGAHVDDSSSYQVYQNSPESALAEQAVKETYGQVLTYEGQVVTTYYFSTSCGHTTDGAVWGGDPEKTPYLTGRALSLAAPEYHLQEEGDFRRFIMQVDEKAYESSFPWYRWQTTVPVQSLNERINQWLSETGESDHLQIRQTDGSFQKGKIATIGTLTELNIVRRGVGGVAEILELTGTKGCVQIETQNAIRQILCSPGYTYIRNGDTHVSQGAMLPSGYIAVEPQYTGDLLSGYTIYGGGSGHGAGMSQNAACYLARIGKAYDEILAEFYKDCILARLY